MPTPTLENVTPLIANENHDGTTLTLVFACPVKGTQVTATHNPDPASGGQSQVGSKVKQAALSSLRGPLSSAIRGAFGSSKFGRALGGIASKSASTALAESSKGQRGPTLSREQRDAAVLAAFTSVSGQFEWDSARDGWVSSAAATEGMTGFQRQVGGAPIDTPYDEEVASRMMIEVASADGDLQEEEREVLKLFIDPALGPIDELAQRPALSAAELDEVSAGPARQSMLAIAWLVALSNDGCDANEADLLERFARALGLSNEDSQSMRELAEEFLVDQMMAKELASGDPGRARARIRDLAATIDMDSERLERAEARFHKRRSLQAGRA